MLSPANMSFTLRSRFIINYLSICGVALCLRPHRCTTHQVVVSLARPHSSYSRLFPSAIISKLCCPHVIVFLSL
ncbi:hypothetical protein EDB19DRAFT_1674430, partial [Suillus lakei]